MDGVEVGGGKLCRQTASHHARLGTAELTANSALVEESGDTGADAVDTVGVVVFADVTDATAPTQWYQQVCGPQRENSIIDCGQIVDCNNDFNHNQIQIYTRKRILL